MHAAAQGWCESCALFVCSCWFLSACASQVRADDKQRPFSASARLGSRMRPTSAAEGSRLELMTEVPPGHVFLFIVARLADPPHPPSPRSRSIASSEIFRATK